MQGCVRGNGRCGQGRGQRPDDDMVDSSEDSSTASSVFSIATNMTSNDDLFLFCCDLHANFCKN